MDAIRDRLSKIPEVVLFRNNQGMLMDVRGVPLRYGLAIGSADLIGSLTVSIMYSDSHTAPGYVEPKQIARALAIEVKRPGKAQTTEQRAWLAMVQRAGWLAGVCHSVAEAEELIGRGLRWEQ